MHYFGLWLYELNNKKRIMNKYTPFLSSILIACAGNNTLTKETPSSAQQQYQIVKIEKITPTYSGAEGITSRIIIYTAIESGIFDTTCVTSDVQDTGRIYLYRSTSPHAISTATINNICTAIDQNNDFYLSMEEVKRYEKVFIHKICDYNASIQ